jgi:23S rRNA pseudouridine955/2504/2580 synthase
MTGVKTIKVAADDDGQRLDRWLKKQLPGVPYVLLQKLLRKGEIRIEGKRAKPDSRLQTGQDVRLPPIKEPVKASFKSGPPKLSAKDADFIRSLVIYDDGHVIALNKPADLAVQGGTSTSRHIDGMLDALKGEDGVRPRLVHRLDKDTSGVLLLARSASVAKALGDTFKYRRAKKIYWAITAPAPELQEGTVRAPLIKAGGRDREKMTVDEEGGKYAATEFVVLESAGHQAAFVAFWPRTGRTHQIRVHASLLGAPILGDRKYGEPQESVEELQVGRRLHLHARRIICAHPGKKATLDISAPLPHDLIKTWKNLGFTTNSSKDPFAGLKD